MGDADMQMEVHHLNCGALRPLGRGFLRDKEVSSRNGTMVCHVLLIDVDGELTLVDTGLGTQDLKTAGGRMPWVFEQVMRPEFGIEHTAMFHVQRLGYPVDAVKHIVMTHLDIDHAGGLSDFPNARVHVAAEEWEEAYIHESFRYQKEQFPESQSGQVVQHDPTEEQWFDIPASRPIPSIPQETRLVHLPGHTYHHCGVAVRSFGDDRWYLHAGDAYFHAASVKHDAPGEPPRLLKGFTRVVADDVEAVKASQESLRELYRSHDSNISMFCTHDRWEYLRLQSRVSNVDG